MPFSMSVFMLSLTKAHYHLTKCIRNGTRRWKGREQKKLTVETEVDWHLPWSDEQQTTYRCQYDWFGCLFGCVRWLGGFFLLLSLACCLLRLRLADRPSQRNVNATKYMASSTTCNVQKKETYTSQSQNKAILIVVFHISYWIYIHGHCIYSYHSFNCLTFLLSFRFDSIRSLFLLLSFDGLAVWRCCWFVHNFMWWNRVVCTKYIEGERTYVTIVSESYAYHIV